jgi:hypothetical protein
MEEAFIRELIREVQEMRKRNKLNVKESIRLSLSSTNKVNEIIQKFADELKKEVGAKELVLDKLSGNCKGKIKFMDIEVEMAFDKI